MKFKINDEVIINSLTNYFVNNTWFGVDGLKGVIIKISNDYAEIDFKCNDEMITDIFNFDDLTLVKGKI